MNNLCSPKLDNTSLALLELYESDGEEETRRNAREVSWESHDTKLSQVHQTRDIKEEVKWLDSNRGPAHSSLLGERPDNEEITRGIFCPLNK